MVVLGEKGKLGAELYNSSHVLREQVWADEWSPKLVKTL
jgi:hypothetical protein